MGSESLKSARVGDVFKIIDVEQGHPLSDRLLELGLHVGETVSVLSEAPLSHDPIVIEVGSTRLALRRSEAALILVEPKFTGGVRS